MLTFACLEGMEALESTLVLEIIIYPLKYLITENIKNLYKTLLYLKEELYWYVRYQILGH